MTKILLTNYSIVNYSGSEIDTVTIANYFLKNGYQVDIFTLRKGNPLMEKINKKIRIITPNEQEKIHERYDIIWSHHYPLLDYILFTLNVKSKHITYISLSSFEPYEALPEYANDLSLIGAITFEVKNKLIEESCRKSKIKLFPNYATNKYFDCQTIINDNIKKICIVSNHVPEELVEFRDIALEKNIKVDIFGIQYTPKYIDEKVLNEYDVIISIGKTVYYAMSMGKPVYCYDNYGGYGYINRNNIKDAFKYNFSGRGFGEKKTSNQILNEIINDYSNVKKDLKIVKKFANDNFNFEKNMEEFIKEVFNNKIDEKSFYKKYAYLSRKSRLYVEKINICNDEIDYLKKKYFELPEYKFLYENEVQKNRDLISSTSWKITYPLRLLKKIIFKIIRK